MRRGNSLSGGLEARRFRWTQAGEELREVPVTVRWIRRARAGRMVGARRITRLALDGMLGAGMIDGTRLGPISV